MANRDFKDVNINVEFEETSNRQQLASGEDVKTLFGKLRKWLSDLKPIAFSGKFSDLSEVPEYTPAQSGLYKITVDKMGNVSNVILATKEDIIALGIIAEYEFIVGDDGHLYTYPKE